ncbi:hypothetical protein RJ639_027977, partial [Escallonia herrerae]
GSGGDATPYHSMSPTAAIAQPQLVTSPMVQPLFNSPALSLALVCISISTSLMCKPKMEGLGEMGLMGRIRDDEYESSDNLEGASRDDQDAPAPSAKSMRKKKYHRHTPYQIQELESSFKRNPHPDEKERLELGKKLSLESKQVKFWFQNRRTQMKTQLERHENAMLKQQNDKLRIENISMKEAMRNPICSSCGSSAILGEVPMEEHHLRIENARLKDELNRICVLANKFLGRPISSLASPMHPVMSNSGLELAVGRNSFDGLGLIDTSLPMGLDFFNALSAVPPAKPENGMSNVEIPFEKSMFLELALAAMDELVKLAQIDNPLWYRSSSGAEEVLNHEEYVRTFPPCIGMKPNGFITDATRASGIIFINSLALVETLMDANRWAEMFTGMIGRASTFDVVSSGMGGTRNGGLQLMHAEIQVVSPMVPVRQVTFIRFSKQHAEGLWAVVDVSVDAIREASNPHTSVYCRRLPSGFVVQDMPNGYAKVTWVEHSEYDESGVQHIFRPLVRSGMGFGAQRWVATLQRQCECLAAIMSSSVPGEDHPVTCKTAITVSGKRSVAKLAQRMTRNFCAGVCATYHKWELVQVGNIGEDARLMIRNGTNNPGEPQGVVLSATMSVWMPVTRQCLFDLLQDERLRSQWDVLSHGGPMQQMVCISKGQDRGNSISLLRSGAAANNGNQNSMLILQETSTDSSGSLIVYAAVDIPGMNVVMSGGESDCVAFLPSGFSIVPDCFAVSGGPDTACNGTSAKEEEGGSGNGNGNGNGNGCLLTVGFQILVNSLPAAKLTMESVDTAKLCKRVSSQERTAGDPCTAGGSDPSKRSKMRNFFSHSTIISRQKAPTPTKFTVTSTRPMSQSTSIPKKQERIRDHGYDNYMEIHKKVIKTLKFQDMILSQPNSMVSIHRLGALAGRQGFKKLEPGQFILKFPHVFEIYEHPVQRILYCRLTRKAHLQIQQENDALMAQLPDAVTRLRKLVMLSNTGRLRLEHVRIARKDFGLPDDFEFSVVLKHPQFFRLFDAKETRNKYIEIVDKDPDLSVCAIEREREREYRERGADAEDIRFSFIVNFPPGFKTGKYYKIAVWKWQRLPYWSPYEDVSGYDMRSLEAQKRMEKRAVATIHELLSLTVEKKITLERIAHFRAAMDLPNKLKHFLLQHQGIFYISTRGNHGKLHTVFLREAYRKGELIEPNDLYLARRRLVELIMLSPRKARMDGEMTNYRRDRLRPEMGDVQDDYVDGHCVRFGDTDNIRQLGKGKEDSDCDMDCEGDSYYTDEDDDCDDSLGVEDSHVAE